MTVEIRQMVPADALTIVRQPSQRIQLGLETPMTMEIAQDLVDGGEAWTAWREGVPIACLGIRDTFPGIQGVAWAILSAGLGRDHLAITRFCRYRLANSPLVRIEAIVSADNEADVVWAHRVGFKPEALLRKFGALSQDHVLYTRIL
jgi:RimJ/RimL family protein N-acetyltransferase